MYEKEFSNSFKLTLTQGNVLLCEKTFDADQFNPFTRYSVDIRDILPKSITKLQKILSKRNYNTVYCDKNFFEYNQKMINLYPSRFRHNMCYNPEPIVQEIDDRGEIKTIRGVECKLIFFINDKIIVERIFYVDGFNPVARWSNDLVDTFVDISNLIQAKIKRNDIKNIWDDYDLINVRGLQFNQIKELSPSLRHEYLRQIGRN